MSGNFGPYKSEWGVKSTMRSCNTASSLYKKTNTWRVNHRLPNIKLVLFLFCRLQLANLSHLTG